MMRPWAWGLTLILTLIGLATLMFSFSPACDAPLLVPTLQTKESADYTLYWLLVPHEGPYEVKPIVSDTLQLLPHLVQQVPNALAAVNAGFFDPNNQQTNSYITLNQTVVADPMTNRQFVENPKLYAYLPAILNRSEFRTLSCGGEIRYQIARHRQNPGFRCNIVHSLQAGPNLFEDTAAETEAFIAIKEGKRIRDPIGVDRPNARTSVGITRHGDVIFAMVAMKDNGKKLSGVSLPQLAKLMKDLGATEALALDGGSSSTFWHQGQTWYGKLNSNKQAVQRPIKSALVVIKKDVAS